MNFESECPKCGDLNSIELDTWDDSLAHPCYCGKCSYFFWMTRTADVSETIIIELQKPREADIPPLKLKTTIYVNNEEHEFFLEQGIIVKKDHKHYRIKFRSTDKRLDGKCVWMPDHWIVEVPKEFLPEPFRRELDF